MPNTNSNTAVALRNTKQDAILALQLHIRNLKNGLDLAKTVAHVKKVLSVPDNWVWNDLCWCELEGNPFFSGREMLRPELEKPGMQKFTFLITKISEKPDVIHRDILAVIAFTEEDAAAYIKLLLYPTKGAQFYVDFFRRDPIRIATRDYWGILLTNR